MNIIPFKFYFHNMQQRETQIETLTNNTPTQQDTTNALQQSPPQILSFGCPINPAKCSVAMAISNPPKKFYNDLLNRYMASLH